MVALFCKGIESILVLLLAPSKMVFVFLISSIRRSRMAFTRAGYTMVAVLQRMRVMKLEEGEERTDTRRQESLFRGLQSVFKITWS